MPLFWDRLVTERRKCVASRSPIPILRLLRPHNMALKEPDVTSSTKLLINGILAIAALGLTQCAEAEESNDTGSDAAVVASDVAAATDVATVSDSTTEVDAGTPADTASPADVAAPADTTAVADVPAVEDVTPEADVVPMGDVAVEEDVAPVEEDVMPEMDAAPPVPDGACTNPEDQAIVDSVDVEKIAEDCAKQNIFSTDNAKKCIKEQTDLSDPCVDCFGGISECVMASCLASGCIDPDSEACKACVDEKCLPKFEECSGLSTEVPEG